MSAEPADSTGPTADRTPELAAALAQALGALRRSDLAGASEMTAKLLEESPRDPAVLQLAATVAIENRDGEAALRFARASLAERPDHVPSLILAGRAERMTGLYAKALASFRDAAARAPLRAEPAFLSCITLLELGDPEANVLLQHLLERFPDDANGWALLADALETAGKPQAALVAYGRAQASLPSAVLSLRSGRILQGLGRLADAADAFRMAESLAPESGDAALGLALCLKQSGDRAGARDAFARLLALDPGRATARFELGLLAQDCGDLAEAINQYRLALSLRPDLAEAAVNLGICLQNKGDLAAAKEAYGRALRARPDTFGRITQALSSAPTGEVWLDHASLRRSLGG